MIMRSSPHELPIDSRIQRLLSRGWQGGGTARPSWRGYAQDTKRNSIKEVFEEVDPEVQMLGSRPKSCRDSTPLAGRNQAA